MKPTMVACPSWVLDRRSFVTAGGAARPLAQNVARRASAPADDFVAAVHDRMPVLLTEEQFALWLSREAGVVEYLRPAPNDYLQWWAVSKRVNSSKARQPTIRR
jgi:putative SOS response-associated peptidase YedK